MIFLYINTCRDVYKRSTKSNWSPVCKWLVVQHVERLLLELLKPYVVMVFLLREFYETNNNKYSTATMIKTKIPIIVPLWMNQRSRLILKLVLLVIFIYICGDVLQVTQITFLVCLSQIFKFSRLQSIFL